MILRGIDFGPIWDASGVRGFFGDGYWFHKLCGSLLDFGGTTFVSKTTTLLPCTGNMPVDENGDPIEYFPQCAVIRPKKGIILNAVGLSGPGLETLLESGRWQQRREPFLISFMAVKETVGERKREVSDFVECLRKHKAEFLAPFGVQLNFSCPNVKTLKASEEAYNSAFFDEVATGLSEVHYLLKTPAIPKFNVLLPIWMARMVAELHECDAICVSNTIPWGALPDRIDWMELFGSIESPLARFGGGGLSGKPLLPLVAEWVKGAREADIQKPINAGGGILCPEDAKILFEAGANSIFIGSAAMLRPWRVKKIIRAARKYAAEIRQTT